MRENLYTTNLPPEAMRENLTLLILPPWQLHFYKVCINNETVGIE
jgi:hypothetical protein